jgi:hypothetical protein
MGRHSGYSGKQLQKKILELKKPAFSSWFLLLNIAYK